MQVTPLKQQLLNYTALFKQMFFDYYRHQKKIFWLVQLWMVVSTLTGVFWILSLILGISHYQNPTQVDGIKQLLFAWVFTLPLWQWLLLASLAGMFSALSLYLSIHYGVNSVLAYQKYLSQKCLSVVADSHNSHWTQEFNQAPRQILLRILKQGVQLTGLVARRVTRAFVSMLTFILAFMLLLYLDAKLLLLLVPFSLLYIIALYFINRYAARVSTAMADTLTTASQRFAKLVNAVLNNTVNIASTEFNQQFDASLYMYQAELKYKRRLAEIHVNWLNTLFLVIGIALIVVYIVYIQAAITIDWQHLLFFLIALRYAASSLQQISATSVAFSRFLPEIELVFRLINSVNISRKPNKIRITQDSIVCISSGHLDNFSIQQLQNSVQFDTNFSLRLVPEIREDGAKDYFKQLPKQATQSILLDNNVERLKRLIASHEQDILPHIHAVLVVASDFETMQTLSLADFQHYTQEPPCDDAEEDMDAFD